MDDETWMDANKAVELHFADRVMERPELYRSDEEDQNKKVPEEEDPDGEKPEEESEKESEKKSEKESEEEDPVKKEKNQIQTGFLYSSRQMAAAFTNKVKKHYAADNAVTSKAEKGRSVDALMDRLNLLHTMM
jgi:ATP-dependent Clp protease protease subunit